MPELRQFFFPKMFIFLFLGGLPPCPPAREPMVKTPQRSATNACSGPKISVPTDKPPALTGPLYDTEKFETSFTQAKWEVTLLDGDDSNMMEN